MTAPAIDLAGIFLLGLSVGLTACAASCLPFIGTWAFSRAGGGSSAALDLGGFLAGRLLGYGLMGAGAGYAGENLLRMLSSPGGNVLIGVAGLAAAAALAAGGKRHAPCRAAASGMPPVAMGLALSLTPCVPLATLLAAAALAGQAATGALMGVMFGLGAAVTPLVIAVPLLGVLGHTIALRPGLTIWLRLGGALVLTLLSLRRIALGL